MEARKPEACATCHSGIDHTNWEAYSLSKHGKVVEVLGNQWNWEVPLKDAFSKGGQTAPTCQTCHMEYEGKFSHNMVRKVRWANYPAAPGIAENIKSDWSAKRLESWVGTCNQCHSESWARSYLDLMDKGTLQGLAKYKEAYAVARKLYDDKLLPGQTGWTTMQTILPDSGAVEHHPFDAEVNHLVDCIRENRESHCNIADAYRTDLEDADARAQYRRSVAQKQGTVIHNYEDAFLDQIQKLYAASDVFFRHTDHQARVGAHQVFLGGVRVGDKGF